MGYLNGLLETLDQLVENCKDVRETYTVNNGVVCIKENETNQAVLIERMLRSKMKEATS